MKSDQPETQAKAPELTSTDVGGRARCCSLSTRVAIVGLVLVLAVLGYVYVQGRQGGSNQPSQPAPRVVINYKPVVEEKKNGQADNNQPLVAEQPTGHPIDPALVVAREGLEHMRKDIHDYTATILKRERMKNGKLEAQQVMSCKIRNRKVDDDGNVVVPMSVYMKFSEPHSIAGREVIWVENQNGGKLVGHEPGIKNLFRYTLDPKGFLAMGGQRYSLDNIGMENLIVKLLERGQQERQRDDPCQVEFIEDTQIDDRPCRLIQITHGKREPDDRFHVARIFIDKERNVPLRYVAFLWPETPDGELPVDEEYTYRDVRLNVGLTDDDFDPDNPQYNYP